MEQTNPQLLTGKENRYDMDVLFGECYHFCSLFGRTIDPGTRISGAGQDFVGRVAFSLTPNFSWVAGVFGGQSQPFQKETTLTIREIAERRHMGSGKA